MGLPFLALPLLRSPSPISKNKRRELTLPLPLGIFLAYKDTTGLNSISSYLGLEERRGWCQLSKCLCYAFLLFNILHQSRA